MDCQFSFGPNRSYFCSTGSAFAWSDNSLPAGLAQLLENKNHPQAMDTPYDVAFPLEPGMYAMCWKTTSGEDWYEDGCMGPQYSRLALFIKNVATTGGRTSRTVFGPAASYFSISLTGYSWQNLPPALEEDIHNCGRLRWPSTVTLGVQGSYVVLYSDGTVTFDLRAQYPLVESLIRNTQEASRRHGLMYIALNPFTAGEYYVVYGDGGAAWNFPIAWSEDVTSISREIRPIPSPAAVISTRTGPPQAVHVAQPVQVSLGGTAPAQLAAPISSGGTNVVASVSYTMQGAAQPTTPPPPAYAPQASAAPVRIVPALAEPETHKKTWQERLAIGVQVAQDIDKIVTVIQDTSDLVSNLPGNSN
ncbi:hypothetical protein DFH09DRAFT_1288589 [Mycena vulgaris]|nr:hypothetical protein DFH09DRAFT_1288589 [Mycena vulgaris]